MFSSAKARIIIFTKNSYLLFPIKINLIKLTTITRPNYYYLYLVFDLESSFFFREDAEASDGPRHNFGTLLLPGLWGTLGAFGAFGVRAIVFLVDVAVDDEVAVRPLSIFFMSSREI